MKFLRMQVVLLEIVLVYSLVGLTGVTGILARVPVQPKEDIIWEYYSGPELTDATGTRELAPTMQRKEGIWKY